MEVWHDPQTGSRARLATDVRVARTRWQQGRGLMFTTGLPEGAALVFPFDGVGRRTLHMVAVPFTIDAIWLVDERVAAVKRLYPMIGFGWANADTVIELPAGVASDVQVGDGVWIEGLS